MRFLWFSRVIVETIWKQILQQDEIFLEMWFGAARGFSVLLP